MTPVVRGSQGTLLLGVYFGLKLWARLDGLVDHIWPVDHQLMITGLQYKLDAMMLSVEIAIGITCKM